MTNADLKRNHRTGAGFLSSWHKGSCCCINHVKRITFRTTPCGRCNPSSALALLATNGKNTVVILWIGCAASAIHRSLLHIAGFLLSTGQSPCLAQVVSVTFFDTAAGGQPVLQSTGFAQLLRTAAPLHPVLFPGCGGRGRSFYRGAYSFYRGTPPGGCRSRFGSWGRRYCCNHRRSAVRHSGEMPCCHGRVLRWL